MENELVFHILGIQETKDEDAIKMAYMTLLKQTNPEDSPEGFKRLREAYEAAVSYAKQADPVLGDEADETEIDIWIDQVTEVYEDMALRRRKSEWRSILSDPVCEELDTAMEARERMLRFLMDHIHLSHEIWEILDQTFRIVEDMTELKEKFPVGFLNYVKYYVENESFIRFELFRIENPEKQNGDKYLEQYFAVKRRLDNKETDRCLVELADLKVFGLYHPYEDVERIRYYLMTEQKEEAAALADKLLERYSDDKYINGWVGEAYSQVGKKEVAYALWQEILEDCPQYYQALIGSIRYLMEQENYYQARELLQELLDGNSQDQEALDSLTACNNHLIEEYSQKLKQGEADSNLSERDMQLELGWCLFQNERISDAIQCVEHFSVNEESKYDFNNLFGRLLYHDKQYEKARPYLKTWLALIEATVDDGTKKMQKRIGRRCRAMNILASCLHELGQDQEAEDYLRQAITIATNPGERLSTMNYLAHTLFLSKQYEKAVDVCDALLREDDGYYPAYLTRQEACFKLNKGQAVVDDYHRAVDIYSGYYKPYLLAAEVFFDNNQNDDANGVLERAKENQVEFTDRMNFLQVKLLRRKAKAGPERQECKRQLEELRDRINEETDIEDLSELEFFMALLAWDDDLHKQALEHLNRAIAQNNTRMQYRWIRGLVYQDSDNYQAALIEFEAVHDDYRLEPDWYYQKALCYEALDKYSLAVEQLQKLLLSRQTYRDTCERLMDYYKKQYETYCREEDLVKAIAYITREVEANPDNYFLIKRGRLYLSAFRIDEAIEDFQKAIAAEPDSWAGHNNLGCCYKYRGQYEKAIACFRQAAACEGKDKSALPYNNMAHCYECLGQYQDAISCYQKNLNLFPDQISIWEDIGDLYVDLGDYYQAFQAYEKMKTEENYYLCIANIHECNGRYGKAFWTYVNGIGNAHLKKQGDLADSWCSLADFAALHIPSIAAFAYQRAIRHCQEDNDKFWYEQKLSTHYYRQKQFAKAKEMAGYAMEDFQKTGRKEEDYVSYPSFAPARLRIMALIHMALGNQERCEQYFERMDQVYRCRCCRRSVCYEKYYFRGLYRETNEDLSGAAVDYEQALEINSTYSNASFLLERLRKKMEKKI